MKIIQVVATINKYSDGVNHAVRGVSRGLMHCGDKVELHCLDEVPVFAQNEPYPILNHIRKRFPIHSIGRSPEMKVALKQATQNADIIHTNGLWMMPNIYPLWAIKGTRCKLVVQPHGTLSRWAMKRSWWKKLPLWWLWQRKVVKKAEMLVATCEKEYEEIRALGFKQPVAIVPIGMEVPTVGKKPRNTRNTRKGCFAQDFQGGNKASEYTENNLTTNSTNEHESLKPQKTEGASPQLPVDSSQFPVGADAQDDATVSQFGVRSSEFQVQSSEQRGCDCVASRDNRQLATSHSPLATEHNRLRRIVFFGRVHKVKAVDHLVKAWGQLQDSLPDWELVIAGPDCGAQGELETIIAEQKIPRVRFVGEINGQAKYDFLSEADIYVLPSHTENFGITVAEALACGTPTIASQGTPWQGLETEKCGKWVPIGVDPLVEALRELTSLTDEERAAMGERGRAWIQRDFSWEGIGMKMKAAYAWLLGQEEKPDFVRVD